MDVGEKSRYQTIGTSRSEWVGWDGGRREIKEEEMSIGSPGINNRSVSPSRVSLMQKHMINEFHTTIPAFRFA